MVLETVNNDIPYIIVDDRKLYPIDRPPGLGHEKTNIKMHKDCPFGIIDRVTISRKARELSKRLNTNSDDRYD
jgi:hypothetical protein